MSAISERIEVLQQGLQEAITRQNQAAQVAATERERILAIQGAIVELQALEPPGEAVLQEETETPVSTEVE